MKRFSYPKEEFVEHFRSIAESRVAGPNTTTGEPLLDLSLHLQKYLHNRDKLRWKTVRMHAALGYLAQNIGAFADDGLIELAPNGASARVSGAVIEALHHYFAEAEMREDVSAAEISRVAQQIEADGPHT